MAAYLDNAATSFPKPSNVIESMTAFMAQNGATSGRGAYQHASLIIPIQRPLYLLKM